MTQPPPDRSVAAAVGPLAQEAAMLLDVVADRLEQMKSSPVDAPAPADPPAPSAAQDPGAAPPAGGPSPTGLPGAGQAPAGPAAAGRCPECGSVPGASCTACPVCRFMALLRGERPEATAKLVDGALLIVRTLRSLVPEPGDPAGAAPPHSHPHPHPHSSREHEPSTPSPRRTGLEHINIL